MALKSPGMTEGVRGGSALAIAVILLALLGLTPSLRWIPEIPLIAVAIAVPVAGYADRLCGWTAIRPVGRGRARRRRRRWNQRHGGRHRLRAVWQASP